MHPPAKRLALAAILALVLGTLAGNAQIITSSIVGQITDPSGGAVPNAQVTVTNTDTGVSVKTMADSSGAYSVPDLQAGAYEVTAQQPGFQTHRVTGVRLLASQSVRVDMRLQVGEVQQTVNVVGEAPLVTTDSQQISGTVSERQMADLPFALQDIDGLLNLVPGAQMAWGASSPQTGGATHWGSFNFTINGIQSNDFGNGGAAYSYGLGLVSLPALQSMQEFKVDAFNTNAEYRQVGTVTMVTKGGTNQLHGEAYEYNENKSLTANSFVNNALGRPRSPFVRNQFGFDVAGPIWRNKAFFFFDYSGNRNRFYAQPQLNIPSVAMRQGDFSALCSTYSGGVCSDPKGTQLYNPFTGNPFSNNRIPSNMITSQAQALLKFLPPPTAPTTTGAPFAQPNYYGLTSTAQDINSADARVDYQISSKDLLYGVYSRNVGFPWEWPLGTPPTYGNGSNYGYKTFGYSLVETHTFSPHTLNDLRLAWFDHPGIRSGQNLDYDPRTIFPQLTPSPNRGLPTMSILGYTGMFTDIGKGYYGHGTSMELTDNITHVHGRHTIKGGVDLTTYKSYGPNPNAPLGSFAFSGQWTGNKGWPSQPQSQGNAFADFLLGVANSSTTGVAGVFEGVYTDWDYEFYIQDTWQATPRLTLYYGLRYMYQTPWWWQNGYSTYWDQTTNKLALPEDTPTATLPPFGASPAQFAAYPFTTTKALGIPKRYMVSDTNNWAPRFGFAFRPFSDNKTVLRGGYGIYYNFNPTFVGSRDDVLNPPWLGGLGGYPGQNYISQLPGKPTAPFLPDVTFNDPFPSRLQVVSGAAPHPGLFSMQRDFQNAMVQQWNLTLERQFGNSWQGRASYVGSQTHHVQWFFGDINVPKTQTPNVPIQDQRPYQPWASILATRSGGKQNFEQLQLEATKRYSYGLSFQAEYSWTRSLDNVDLVGGPQNWNFPNLDYGNTPFVRRHQLVFNYLWELPIGHGKPWLGGAGRALDAVVGGWEVAGITTYATGTPFSVGFQVPSSYIGWWGGRADQVGSNIYARQSSHDIFSGVSWLNTSAFAPPTPWTWGNAARDMVFGPGYWNWDISVLKNFLAHERVHLQLRGDFLDAFNHFNLGGPNSTIADTRDGGPPIPSAGKIFGGSGSRVVQVGAKVVF